jgi:vacuolar-type H+-ATPase subunit H
LVQVARRSAQARSDAVEDLQSASTLTQIREKELEFDGLVMVARTEAERRLREATQQADDAIRKAEAEAESLATKQEAAAISAAETDAALALRSAEEEVARLATLAEARRRATVDTIVSSVMGL